MANWVRYATRARIHGCNGDRFMSVSVTHTPVVVDDGLHRTQDNNQQNDFANITMHEWRLQSQLASLQPPWHRSVQLFSSNHHYFKIFNGIEIPNCLINIDWCCVVAQRFPHNPPPYSFLFCCCSLGPWVAFDPVSLRWASWWDDDNQRLRRVEGLDAAWMASNQSVRHFESKLLQAFSFCFLFIFLSFFLVHLSCLFSHNGSSKALKLLSSDVHTLMRWNWILN